MNVVTAFPFIAEGRLGSSVTLICKNRFFSWIWKGQASQADGIAYAKGQKQVQAGVALLGAGW